MICKMSFDVRILYVHVNVTLTKFAIRLGPVSGGRSGNRCRLCIGKPLLMRKLEPRYDNPPLASSSLSILTKRFVLSIVKHCYMCVIGFLLKISAIQYYTLPLLSCLDHPSRRLNSYEEGSSFEEGSKNPANRAAGSGCGLRGVGF